MTVSLTNAEISAYQQIQGQLTSRALTNLLANPKWAAAPMAAKVEPLAAILRAIHNTAKLQVLGSQDDLLNRARERIQQQRAPAPVTP